MSVVQSETTGGVCTVTLADTENRNALSAGLVVELTEVLDEAETDDAVRVIVLTNTGRVFCAGANLAERSGRSRDSGSERTANASGSDRSVGDNRTAGADRSAGDNRTAGADRSAGASGLFARFGRSPKPYVGRIAGHCVAGGMGIAAAMDISIAVDWAKMGFTEVRVGVAPAMISVICLPKMRAGDARSAFLRGNKFPAGEAVRIGLINAAVPDDDLDSAVDEVVQDLLAGSPAGLAASKQLLARVPELGTDDAFAWTSKFSASLFGGDDAREGMAAFLEKRPARWVRVADRGS